MGIFELKPERVGHFTEGSIFIKQTCVMLEGELKFDFVVVILEGRCGQFARYVRVAVRLPVLAFIGCSGLLFFGTTLFENGSVVFKGTFRHDTKLRFNYKRWRFIIKILFPFII